jgi:predicted metalloprotease with PDZ domain
VGGDAIGLSTLGPGDVALDKPEPADFLAGSFFMGGHVAHYPDTLSGEGFSSAWQGEAPFDTHALMAWTSKLYDYYLGFFHASPKLPYAVFLRRNPVNAGGGVEIGHSFVGTFDKNTKAQDLKLTLAHEMVHTFVGTLDSATEDLSLSWYSEGLAVYYERLLPLRAGEITPQQYLDDINQTAGRYYADLLNDAPNDRIAARFWADTRVRVLPYDRGALYFAALNEQIRKASGGKRSLDDLVLAMLDRRAHGLPADENAWTALLQKELGPAGVQSFREMLAGKLVLPGADAFGPCFTRTTAQLRRYELGFDTDVLIQPKRIVRGLVPGSAAALAGLRDGDEIVKPVPQDAIQADQNATLTMLIRRDGKEFPITYLPRGEAVQVYQWKRVPGTKDKTCRKW